MLVPLSKSRKVLSSATQGIEDAVTALLAEAKVTVACTYAGEVDKRDWTEGKKNIMDHWRVSMVKVAVRDPYQTDYYTGTGHHEPLKTPPKRYDKRDGVWTAYYEPRPVVPTPASILYCLCSDATSVDGNTFASWASDLGYSTDSIKARDIYMACQDTHTQLVRLFGHDMFGKLCDAVREY